MSTTIENRIVEMRFENGQFEREVKNSLGTLDKLKQALDFKGATKGLDSIASAAKGFSLTAIDTAVTTVSDKFSAFEQMAIGALRNIGAKAVETGTELLKGLSVDNISAGWGKYVDKTASVQAIMNATGKSIDEVNGYLDQLMWYSDETSFGFTDMTQALAQMTSSGGDIEKIVPMLMGVGNATAFAGKGSSEFQRSIYNLSQSYGSGYLQWLDWKSLEGAGTSSKQLKEALIDAAVALGKIDEGTVTLENFKDTLKNGWADRDVMEAAFGRFAEQTEKAYELVQSGQFELASDAYEYLNQFSDDFTMKAAQAAQEAKSWEEAVDSVKDAVSSGWMNSFEQIFGNYEEGKKVWTWWANTLWEVFNGGAKFRNDVLAGWKEAGGRDLNIWGIYNTWTALADVIGTVKEAAMGVFGLDKDEEGWISFLLDLSHRFYDWSESIIPTNEQLLNIKFTAEKVFTVINRLRQVVGAALSKAFNGARIAVSAFKEAFSSVFTNSAYVGIVVFLRNLKDLITNFKLSEGATENLKKAFAGFLSIFSLIGKAVSAFVDVFGADIMNIFGALIEKVLDLAGRIGDFIKGLNDSAGETDFFKNTFTSLRDVIVTVADKIRTGFSNIKTAVLDFVDAIKENEQFNAFVDKLKEFKDILWDVASDAVGALFDKVSSWFSTIGDSLPTAEQVADTVGNIAGKLTEFIGMLENADFSSVKEFFTGIFSGGEGGDDQTLIGSLIEKVKNVITAVFTDQGVIDTAKSGVTGFLTNMKDAITQFFNDNFGDVGIADILKALNLVALLRIATALGNFFGGVADALEDVGSIPGEVLNVLKALKTTIVSYQAEINATTLLKVAGAIVLLTAAIVGLSFVPQEKLSTAVVALSAVLGMLVLLANAITNLMKAKGLAAMNYLDYIGQGVGRALKSFGTAAKFYAFGTAFLEVVIGLGLIVAEIYIFAKMLETNGEAMNAAMIKLGILLGSIAAIIATIGAFNFNASSMAAFGKAFVELGIAFIAVGLALKIIAGIKGDVVTAAVVLGLFTALMGGVILMIGQSTNISEGDITKIGNTFLKLGATMLIISAALVIVSSIPANKVQKDAIALGIALIAVVAALALVDNHVFSDSSVNSLLKATSSLLIVSAAISMIARSGADWETFKLLAASFATAMAILLIAAGISSIEPIAIGLEVLGSAIALIGLGMLGAGVGVLAFAAAIGILAQNSEAVPTVMANVAAGIISFGSTIRGHLGDLLAFIAAMAAFAVAGAVITVAVVAIVAAIIILGAALTKCLKDIGVGINVGGAAILAGVAALLVLILAFIANAVPGFVSSLVRSVIILINEVSLAIIDNTGPLFEAIGILLVTLRNMIGQGVMYMIAGILEAIPGFGDDIAKELKTMADNTFGPNSEAAAALRDNNEQLRAQNEEAWNQFASIPSEAVKQGEKPDYAGQYAPTAEDTAAVSDSMHNLGETASGEYKKTVEGANTPEVAKGLTAEDAHAEQRAAAKALGDTFNEELKSDIENAEPIGVGQGNRPVAREKYVTEATEDGETYTVTLRDAVDDGMGPVGNSIEDPLRSIDFSSIGLDGATDLTSGFGSGIMGNSSMLEQYGFDASTFTLDGLGNTDGAYTTGLDVGSMFGSGLNDSNPVLQQSGFDLSGSALSGFSMNTEDANLTGQDAASAIADGMLSNESAITDAASQLSSAANTAFGDSYDSAFQAGSSVSFGFGAGMYSNMSAVSEAAGYISDAAAGKFDEGADEANTAGQNLVSQFSVGIVLKNGIAESSAQFVADNVEGKLDSKQTDAFQSGQMLIQQFSNGIRLMTNQAITAVLNIVQNATRNLQTTVPAAQRTGTSVVSTLAATLRNSGTVANAAYQLGVTVSNSIANGINAYSGRVSSAASYIVNYLSYYKSSTYNYGYNAGANFSLGMGYGISAYAYAAANAAAAVAARAAAAARARLRIASPSRVAAEIGMYFDQGLAVGIRDNVGDIESASEYATENALNSFNQIVSRIQDVLDGSIDIDPTIRPVLDLSAIQNGANQLDGMLSGSYSYATNASGGLNGISSTSQIMTGLDAIASKLTNQKQSPNISITVNAGDISDPDELASIISDRIQFEYAQIGASIGGGY